MKKERIRVKCIELAKKVGQNFDEHGYSRGDYLKTTAIDYVSACKAKRKPYFDMGGAGLALISIKRTRRYASSWKYGPGKAYTEYLIGRNEAGTYFAHPVSRQCATVKEAIKWIWNGMEDKIIQRQGDIALISGVRQKKYNLPTGHKIEGDFIVHATHPKVRLPLKKEGVIVGKRAFIYVSEATRD